MSRFFIFIVSLAATATAASAASIRVAPVLVDATLPAKSAIVTLRNEGDASVAVQARVFRWRQVEGSDQLEPTNTVVASPPIGNLRAGSENIVRIVRVAPDAIDREESYRLVIDQLPDDKDRKPGAINLLIRHSIPVFFANPGAVVPKVNWSVAKVGGKYTIVATNSGGTRIRISNLVMKTREGGQLIKADGLVGYVLAGSMARWSFASARTSYSGVAEITAQSEAGPIHAQVTLSR